jgi:hypothetical protein
MKFGRKGIVNRIGGAGMALALGATLLASGSVAPQSAQAQSATCNFATASLNPRGVFQSQINSYAQNILKLRLNAVTIDPTVNSANLLQNASVRFNALNGRASGTFFNLNLGANFPAQSTANLPRPAFNPLGTLAFYTYAGAYDATQVAQVQAVYAQDQVSRRNYAFNVANLARHWTALQNAGAPTVVTGFALGRLRTAYTALSNPTAASPNPRQLYRDMTVAYVALMRNIQAGVVIDPATMTQAQLESNLTSLSSSDMVNTCVVGGMLVRTGLNILAIGLSNYDTNRLPVNGSSSPTTVAAPAGTFPLLAFDTARAQTLSQPQLNPAGQFARNIVGTLRRYGFRNISIDGNALNYQVNSADALQFVFVPIGDSFNTLTIWYAAGFPSSPTAVPQFAFSSTSANRYFCGPGQAQPFALAQASLTRHYNDPANAGRRGNYTANLNNLLCSLQRIQTQGGLNTASAGAVGTAINQVNGALATLRNGGVPDVFGVYGSVAQATNALDAQTLTGANQNADKDALKITLLPIGIINYYLVPMTISPAITLQVRNGQFASAENGGGAGVSAFRPNPVGWETFGVVDLNGGTLNSGDTINLQARDGQFVAAEGGGGGAVNANRAQAVTWEQFVITSATGGPIVNGSVVTLRTFNGVNFMSAVNGGGGTNVMNSAPTTAGPNERFVVNFR